MSKLKELTLELTDWCPLQCLHCSSLSDGSCRNYLGEKLAVNLIEQAACLGAEKISFGGGEPTAATSFFPSLDRVIELGMLAEVFTCGIQKKGRSFSALSNKFLNKFQNVNEVKFIFSLYGTTPDIHDCITTVPGSFLMLIKSLRKLLESGIRCEINFVPLKSNISQFDDVVRFVEDVNLTKISILRFVPQGRGSLYRHELELSPEEESQFVERLLTLRKNTQIEIRTGSPFNGIVPGNKVPCRAGHEKLVVQANGNVLPCEVFKHHDRCDWGFSVYKQSLSDILNSSRLISLRDSLDSSSCMKCPVHSLAKICLPKGCPA